MGFVSQVAEDDEFSDVVEKISRKSAIQVP